VTRGQSRQLARSSLLLAAQVGLKTLFPFPNSLFPIPCASASAQSPEVRKFIAVEAPVVALTHVRVVDGTGAAPLDDRTIVLSGARISQFGPAAKVTIPAGARVLDLGGHTVIPGIVGLHDHTFYATEERWAQLSVSGPRLYLGSGVTTIRTTGSFAPYVELNLKHSIERGEVPGPRIHIAGPYITGPDPSSAKHHVTKPEEARRAVAYWAEEGATWFKVHNSIGRAELEAAIDEAHRRGLKLTGHLCSVTFREAVALGIDNLEHGLLAPNTDYDPDKKPDLCPPGAIQRLEQLEVGSEPVATTFREMIARGVAMTSTLVYYESFSPGRPPLEDRVLDLLLPAVKAEYLASRERIANGTAQLIVSPKLLRVAMDYERAFVKAGGLLAAGVDPTSNGIVIPGFGDQRNFELLVEAGFPPVQAIQIMTANGAKVLGQLDRLGTIAEGKIADLVVIGGDPVADPATIRNVTLVFKDGVGYDSAKLIESVKGLVGLR
jgi:imidazolonepropionase-like amidohydrolase